MTTAILVRVAKLALWLLRTLFLSRHALAFENLALRQQLAALKDRRQRPRLDGFDRAFWVGLRQVWAGWLDSLLIVKPDTVVSWHRRGFRLYWRLLSRGRPRIDPHLRKLIRRMVRDNPTYVKRADMWNWGAGQLAAAGWLMETHYETVKGQYASSLTADDPRDSRPASSQERIRCSCRNGDRSAAGRR